MPLQYEYVALPDPATPQASSPLLQYALNTYASETNKVISWVIHSSNQRCVRSP
jgi:hypothetical protein